MDTLGGSLKDSEIRGACIFFSCLGWASEHNYLCCFWLSVAYVILWFWECVACDPESNGWIKYGKIGVILCAQTLVGMLLEYLMWPLSW